LVIPKEEDSALSINGKKNNLTRSDFDASADDSEILPKIRYETFQEKTAPIKKHIRSGSRRILRRNFQRSLIRGMTGLN
jgi:hypothetical protein